MKSEIQKHNFEKSKNEIAEASKNVPTSTSLNSFPTKGSIFRFTEHNVTGDELNKLLVKPLQETLIALNTSVIGLFEITNKVYETIDFLDKEYLAGIEVSIKAANEASDQAIEAFKEATKAQEDITRTVNALKKTVDVLKKFKDDVSVELKSLVTIQSQLENHDSKIESIEQDLNIFIQDTEILKTFTATLNNIIHLKAVDAIWSDVESHKSELTNIHQQLEAFIERTNGIASGIREDIALLQQYRSLLESYQHLGDVDAIWSDVESHKSELTNIHQQLEAFIERTNGIASGIREDIALLQQYRSLLESYQHLGDVDAMWGDVESHKSELTNIHKQLETFIERTNGTTNSIREDIALLQQYRSLLESYQHLGEVDAMWGDVESHKSELTNIHQQLETFIERTNGIASGIREDIALLQQYRSLLESYQHLGDVDAMWSDVESHKVELANIHQQLDTFIERTNGTTNSIREDIALLQQYRLLLESYQHLGDVDAMWGDVEDHKKKLEDIQQQLDSFTFSTQNSLNGLMESMTKQEHANIEMRLKLEKKLKIAYCVGGGAVVITLLNYLLQILNVL
jgi:cytochrome c556